MLLLISFAAQPLHCLKNISSFNARLFGDRNTNVTLKRRNIFARLICRSTIAEHGKRIRKFRARKTNPNTGFQRGFCNARSIHKLVGTVQMAETAASYQ